MAALERMLSLPKSSKPCLVVDDTVTKRFVQFYGGFGDRPTIDVPFAPQAPNGHFFMRAGRVFTPDKLVFEIGDGERLPVYRSECDSVEAAVMLARRVLTEVLCLPDAAILKLDEIQQTPSVTS